MLFVGLFQSSNSRLLSTAAGREGMGGGGWSSKKPRPHKGIAFRPANIRRRLWTRAKILFSSPFSHDAEKKKKLSRLEKISQA